MASLTHACALLLLALPASVSNALSTHSNAAPHLFSKERCAVRESAVSVRALRRLRGGSDILQPTVPSDSEYSPEQLGRLHLLWWPARHATLKGVVAGALAFSALGGTVPTSGALASQPALWLGARAFVALALGLVARAVDWKLLLVCALSAHALGSLFGSGESNLLERAFDITRWPGGSVPGLRDKV
eukprot:CAMPEP_0179883506 /NCGR_PEP_ID=MMETSP0982-20121206/28756_1 /TAXON_ID=483367 /ORGANISM="non described non described, Strain CCMP 2436" /LENGTH=187 /DNA_ID=CAMNT_0021777969 /DNA_START=80 /DNA_END=639 /DNA_ORIENTATION=-